MNNVSWDNRGIMLGQFFYFVGHDNFVTMLKQCWDNNFNVGNITIIFIFKQKPSNKEYSWSHIKFVDIQCFSTRCPANDFVVYTFTPIHSSKVNRNTG